MKSIHVIIYLSLILTCKLLFGAGVVLKAPRRPPPPPPLPYDIDDITVAAGAGAQVNANDQYDFIDDIYNTIVRGPLPQRRTPIDYTKIIADELKNGGSIGQANARVNLIKAEGSLLEIARDENRLKREQFDQKHWNYDYYKKIENTYMQRRLKLENDRKKAKDNLTKARTLYNNEVQAALDAKAQAKEIAGAGAGAGA